MEVWMWLIVAGFGLVAVYGALMLTLAGREWNEIRRGMMPRLEIADEIPLSNGEWDSKYKFRAAATVNPGDKNVGEKPFVEDDIVVDVVAVDDLRFGTALSLHIPLTSQREAGDWVLKSLSERDRDRLEQSFLDRYYETLNEKIWGRSPCLEAMGDLLGSRSVNN